jgi:hypothetical protein
MTPVVFEPTISAGERPQTYALDSAATFLKRFIAQKIQRDTQGYKTVPLTNLPQLSFAEASGRVSTVLRMYKCSSENKYKGNNTAAVTATETGDTLVK